MHIVYALYQPVMQCKDDYFISKLYIIYKCLQLRLLCAHSIMNHYLRYFKLQITVQSLLLSITWLIPHSIMNHYLRYFKLQITVQSLLKMNINCYSFILIVLLCEPLPIERSATILFLEIKAMSLKVSSTVCNLY
jgi:hypothetical protein